MTDIAATDELFFTRSGLERSRVESIVGDALAGADDGELYLEYAQSESRVFDDGRLKNASFDTAQGFGLRAVAGETSGYSHASELSEDALRRAAATVRAVHAGHGGEMAAPPGATNQTLDNLADKGIDIINLDYDKVALNGGGIHCSTCPLIRDSVH